MMVYVVVVKMVDSDSDAEVDAAGVTGLDVL